MDQSPQVAFERYVALSNERRLDEAMSYIADDAIYCFSNETHYHQKASIRAAFEKNFTVIEEGHYSIVDPVWQVVTAEAAVCIFRYEWSGKIGGEQVNGAGRGTCVLRKDHGQWRIVHEHLSRGSL